MGNLVVDLASFAIVAGVFAIAVVRTTDPSPDEQSLLSDARADRGYFGPNPSDDGDAAHGH